MRILTPAVLFGLFLTAAAMNRIYAQGAKVSSPAELARRADQLKPGEWVWAPNVAPSGPVLIYVDLSKQLATVYRNGVRIAVSTVSSGKPGHETPTGVFTILQKDQYHKSKKYNNAPMPYQERLTWDGVALHAGGLPGYPESHGCIHLPYNFSKELFGITSLGATVVVQGNATTHVKTASESLLVPIDAKGAASAPQSLDSQEYRWTPEKSPSGPVTIIISKQDQAIVVIRNGIEIGRSAATIDSVDDSSHVITLTKAPDGKLRWVYTGIPGHDDDAGRELDEATANRVHMPKPFYDSVKAILQPGTTVLVTQSSVGEGDTGKRITIMDAIVPAI